MRVKLIVKAIAAAMLLPLLASGLHDAASAKQSDTPPSPPRPDTPPPPPRPDTPPPPPRPDTPPPPPRPDTPPPPPRPDTPPPTPRPDTPEVEEAVSDSLTQVAGAVSEPLNRDESEPQDPDEPTQRGDNSSFNQATTDSLAVFENGDGVTETTEEQRLCVHGVSESACGAEEEEKPEEE